MSETQNNMSTAANTDSKSKKKRKNKKKGANTNGQVDAAEVAKSQEVEKQSHDGDKEGSEASEGELDVEENDATPRTNAPTENSMKEQEAVVATNGAASENDHATPDDPTLRFDALVRDRDALRVEVTQLRQSLEQLQREHNEEMATVQRELEDTQGDKDRAEDQYQSLLGKVHTLRSQLGERLKENAEELSQAQTRIEELEEQKSDLQENYTTRSAELEEIQSQKKAQETELDSLRTRLTLSQQNWLKERDELLESESYVREEFENAKQAMHDWEVLAMEERQIRRDLTDKVADLEEQLATTRADYERSAAERETQNSTVDGLQRAMQEIQDARRKELRELVETSQAEQQTLRQKVEDLQAMNDKSTTEMEETRKELERTLPFEKEVKEKNLLIGKLRHEAVILNDHLTKALRFLKKGKPDDNVDRQIVTNHFLQFLALDRSDPKKFQILQLIASLLNWSDEQKEQAGLARPGGGAGASHLSSSGLGITGSLRLPSSPLSGMYRTPSTPSLGQAEYFGSLDSVHSPSTRESLADLWQNFLEQEASSHSHGSGGAKARSVSAASPKIGTGTTSTGKLAPSSPSPSK